MKYALVVWLLLSSIALAQTPKPDAPAKPAPKGVTPTVADYAYGTDSERQKFDLYLAKSDSPTPLLLMIHGGGWKGGDKSSYATQVTPYLNAGISVAAINYRFIAQAMEQKVEPPVKACLYDAARALQTIRAKASDWNIDKTRVGATGGSAGACTSLWLALHDDLADPKSNDPIARESTRLLCAAVNGAQTSLDPKELREWMPNANYAGHAFGFAAEGRSRPEEFELLIANREKVLPWINEYSPIRHVSKDDPAIFLDYPNQKERAEFGKDEKDPTHSVLYGFALAEKMTEVGVECFVNYPLKPDDRYGSIPVFLKARLRSPLDSPAKK
jgi:acetyl esterase/lipase